MYVPRFQPWDDILQNKYTKQGNIFWKNIYLGPSHRLPVCSRDQSISSALLLFQLVSQSLPVLIGMHRITDSLLFKLFTSFTSYSKLNI